jgi:hypothetical protein
VRKWSLKEALVMPKKRFNAEQIVTLPRQLEVSIAQGKSAPVASRELAYRFRVTTAGATDHRPTTNHLDEILPMQYSLTAGSKNPLGRDKHAFLKAQPFACRHWRWCRCLRNTTNINSRRCAWLPDGACPRDYFPILSHR